MAPVDLAAADNSRWTTPDVPGLLESIAALNACSMMLKSAMVKRISPESFPGSDVNSVDHIKLPGKPERAGRRADAICGFGGWIPQQSRTYNLC